MHTAALNVEIERQLSIIGAVSVTDSCVGRLCRQASSSLQYTGTLVYHRMLAPAFLSRNKIVVTRYESEK